MALPLASSVNNDRLTIWIGDGQPDITLTTEDVTVTIGHHGDPLAISAPRPKESADLWPLNDADPAYSPHHQATAPNPNI